ncbi:KRAB-A domain-containing protein 2-like [Aplysia californica]|uniref:KRAB-A domain-containing protein 2-like n=1 Tax=Aplysia californica TaxID=6500 RepID=A0ABM0JKQ8_APLCA|nr:KRAB-A domain-containing protein 2-like [Aplysia californica]
MPKETKTADDEGCCRSSNTHQGVLAKGQVDLIDMRSMQSGSNKKWMMVYQDHLTKFCILRALTSKRAAGVAFHLLDIFLLNGARVILKSNNRSEFTSQVITELKKVWPNLKMVDGKPRHPQSQGSVERANGDIKDMLVAWKADNDSQDWLTGIKFVHFQKNSSLHSGTKCSPYSAMFGCEARVGLTTSSLPEEVIARIETEEDFLAVNENPLSLSLTDGAANQIQTASDETPTVSVTDGVLLPVQLESTSAQDIDLSTGPSLPTATPSVYDVDCPGSYGQSEDHVTSLLPSPSDSPGPLLKTLG